MIASPHGERSGVYAAIDGSLAPKGVKGVAVTRAGDDDAGSRVAKGAGLPMLDGPVDHGIVVPLVMLGGTAPVVAVSLRDASEAFALARAIEELCASGTDVLFIASAHGAAALTPAAPLTYRPEAERVETDLLDQLPRDAGAAARLAARLETEGGSCSGATLTAFGAIFDGRPARVLAHGWPFGVGYIVATVERDL